MIVGLHHVALGVPDLDDGIAFYTEHFGFELGSAARGAMLKTSNAFVELWQYEEPAPVERCADPNDRGYVHICLQVRDIEVEHKRLTEAGMTFVGPPVDFGTSSAIYGRDPFGNVVELYELRKAEQAQLVGRATN